MVLRFCQEVNENVMIFYLRHPIRLMVDYFECKHICIIEDTYNNMQHSCNVWNGGNFFKDGLSVRPASLHLEINLTLEIGQLLLSLLHAWGLDKDLDKVATTKLGLLRPRVPVSYGILSRGGAIMSLMLPTLNPGNPTWNDKLWRRIRPGYFDLLFRL